MGRRHRPDYRLFIRPHSVARGSAQNLVILRGHSNGRFVDWYLVTAVPLVGYCLGFVDDPLPASIRDVPNRFFCSTWRALY